VSSLSGRRFFCSWSGGKDCCLAFHKAAELGAVPHSLVTMLREDGERSRSHGLPVSVLKAQAEALGVRLITRATSWDGYRAAFLDALTEVRSDGVDLGVFGDIDMEDHRKWVSDICSEVDIEPLLPLWMQERETLLEELLSSGYRTMIIAVKEQALDPRYLGRSLSQDTIRDLGFEGIDLSGEAGEYHTVVTDGPIFKRPLRIEKGAVASKDGYSFLEVDVLRDSNGRNGIHLSASSDNPPGERL